jgi:hypothetical protein
MKILYVVQTLCQLIHFVAFLIIFAIHEQTFVHISFMLAAIIFILCIHAADTAANLAFTTE